MLEILRKLFGRSSSVPLTADEREGVESHLALALAGARFISDNTHPSVVIAAFAADLMKKAAVTSPANLGDPEIRQLKHIISAAFEPDAAYQALLKTVRGDFRSTLQAIRQRTAVGRAETLSGNRKGRSAEDVIQTFGLKPVDPLKRRD